MATSYQTPGVYIEEVDKGPKPIEGVGTAVAAFVGYSEKATMEIRRNGRTSLVGVLNKPQLVTNWSQYVETFGGFVEGACMPQSVYGYFLNGGSICYVTSVKTLPKAKATLVWNAEKTKSLLTAEATKAGFDGRMLRIKIEAAPPPAPSANGTASQANAQPPSGDAKGDGKDEDPQAQTVAGKKQKPAGGAAVNNDKAQPIAPMFTVVVQREEFAEWHVEEKATVSLVEDVTATGKTVKVQTISPRELKLITLLVAPLEGTETLDTRVPAPDLQQQLNIDNMQFEGATQADYVGDGDADVPTGLAALQALDNITMLVLPELMGRKLDGTVDVEAAKAAQRAIIDHCEQMADRVAILDTPPSLNAKDARKWRMETTNFDSSYATMYYPWIQIQDPVTNKPLMIPPSGHMAGIWARSDSARGVHKAPANETIRGAVGLERNITFGEQATLNPEGVNCLRTFPGMGIRVWGARTQSSNPSWRYLNVRRLFNFIEKSIQRGTQWVVFEPNDPRLWGRVRRDVSAFLTNVWRTGALFGLTPDESFYVKCDEETNPPSQRNVGMLVIEIGIAPVKPAEFVIFRISQWAGPGSED